MPGMFHFDPLYWILILPCLALSGLCAAWVKNAFAEWSRVGARSGLTGAQIAQAILDFNDVRGVTIEPVSGFLSDHYDPRSRTLRLSQDNYAGRSIAALGVAAHEVGHAIQHSQGYAPLQFRSALVPILSIGSNLTFPLFFLGMFMRLPGLVLIAVAIFALTTLFTLVTLPVEFDASRRALLALEKGRILGDDELPGARKVLRAAGATYVAAAITSIATLIYYLIRSGILSGGRRD